MSSGVEIYFDDALTADQRAHAEQSVVAIVEDKRAQGAAERARSAELDKLGAAINVPLSELIQQHPYAAEALRQVGAQSLERGEEFLPPQPAHGLGVHTITVSPEDRSVEVRVLPTTFTGDLMTPTGRRPLPLSGTLAGVSGWTRVTSQA
jgi:hypothetical protein